LTGVAGERFDPEELAALPVEDAAAVPDLPIPRAAPLLSYLPRARRRWRVLAGVSTGLGVLSVLLAALRLAPQVGLGWGLAVLWFAQAVVYVYVGCAEARSVHPVVIEEPPPDRARG
jgi:hypothetical protein